MIRLYADFETTKTIYDNSYDNFYEAYKDNKVEKFPIVYAWSICYEISNKKYLTIFNLTNEVKNDYHWIVRDNHLFVYGININSFIKFISNISQKCAIWFHNGAKFDFHFIVLALTNNNFVYVPNFKSLEHFKDNNLMRKRKLWMEKKLNQKFCAKNWNILHSFEYNSLTDGTRKIFKIQIANDKKHFDSKKQKYDNILINLRDSNLLFPGSLESYGEKLNQIYNTNIYSKKSISYERIELYDSIEQLENDKLEFEYLLQDTLILCKFITTMGNKKELPYHKWRTTSASTAFSEWENQYALNSFNYHILDNKNIKTLKSNYKLYWSEWSKKFVNENVWKKQFTRQNFPIEWLNKTNNDKVIGNELHNKWYNGGMTMVNENYRGVYLDKVNGYDINSSYPSVMNSNSLCPIGIPTQPNDNIPNLEKYELMEIRILRKIENKNGIPFFIDRSNETKNKNYLSVLSKDMKSYIDTNEYIRFTKYYSNKIHRDYEVIIHYRFDSVKMKDVFGTFIDKWYAIKNDAKDELSKTIAKLMLNSTYGKFGTKLEREKKEWNQYENDWTSFTSIEKAKYYLPIAIAITSLARCKLIDAVSSNYSKFFYCDTDSIYWNANYEFSGNISSNLGDWKKENTLSLSGVFRRPKQYLLRNGIDKDKMVYAGINFGKLEQDWVKSITFKDFVYGLNIPKQLRSYKIQGIVILENITKDIKPIWFYKPLPEQIYTSKRDYDKLWKNFKLNKHIDFSTKREKLSEKLLTHFSYKS